MHIKTVFLVLPPDRSVGRHVTTSTAIGSAGTLREAANVATSYSVPILSMRYNDIAKHITEGPDGFYCNRGDRAHGPKPKDAMLQFPPTGTDASGEQSDAGGSDTGHLGDADADPYA